jgi:hypothetical protein
VEDDSTVVEDPSKAFTYPPYGLSDHEFIHAVNIIDPVITLDNNVALDSIQDNDDALITHDEQHRNRPPPALPDDTKIFHVHKHKPVSFDGPCTQVDTGAKVTCTNLKHYLHQYHPFSKSRPCPINLGPIEEGRRIIPEGDGYLYVPGPDNSFLPVHTYFTPLISTTIISDNSLLAINGDEDDFALYNFFVIAILDRALSMHIIPKPLRRMLSFTASIGMVTATLNR